MSSTFTERNLAPRTPAGATIPIGARRTLLAWFQQRGLTPSNLWQQFVQREAYGTWGEIDEDLRTRFGDEEANTFATAMTEHRKRANKRIVVNLGIDYDAEPALVALPPALFLDVLELALKSAASYGTPPFDSVNEINRIFTKLGVIYKFTFSGQAEWHGDSGTYELVLRPALNALADPRLAGCATEFHAALGHLRAGTEKDREGAVEESGKAVESAMKVLLQAHGIALTGTETAFPLFDLLVDNGICPREANHAVLGAARPRNNLGAHGTGAQPRVVPPGVPELSVHAAATAIQYLASLLP